VAYADAPATGYNVFDHSLDAVARHLASGAGAARGTALSATCQACEIRPACGGGLYPHRFRRWNGFNNPSVYCNDLARLILHVQERIRRDLATFTATGPTSRGRQVRS